MPVHITDDRILEATMAQIREHGPRGVTTRGLARAAGINEVTLFRRFGDKRALIRAAVHDAIGKLGSGRFTATDDVRADLAAIVRFYAGAFDPERGIAVALLTETSRHPDLSDLLAEPAAVAGRVVEVIRHHQRRGALTPEPPGEALAALIGPLFFAGLGFTVERFSPHQVSTDERVDRLVDRFLGGHAAT